MLRVGVEDRLNAKRQKSYWKREADGSVTAVSYLGCEALALDEETSIGVLILYATGPDHLAAIKAGGEPGRLQLHLTADKVKGLAAVLTESLTLIAKPVVKN